MSTMHHAVSVRLTTTAATLLFAFGLSLSAYAAEATAQQNKMTMCNQKATGMKGDERKQFMSSCLKKDSPAGTQQEKMKYCNEAATGKKGDERKAFMSQCLKKSAA
jgi:hypothetical protein